MNGKKNTSQLLTCLRFTVLENEFEICTGDPELAGVCPLMCFGAEVFDAGPCGRPRPAAFRLLLVSDAGAVRDLKDELPDVEKARIGPGDTDFMCFSPAALSGVALLGGAGAARVRAAMHSVSLFVRMTLKKDGIFFLHAAAAAGGGAVAVFAGENESGKSTLARTLVCNGWDLFSDDSLPVKLDGEKVYALPMREPFNAALLSGEEWRNLEARGFSQAPVERFMIPPAPISGPAPIAAVFYPRWDDSSDGPQPADAAFVFKSLYRACNTPLFTGDILAYDRVVETVARQAGHFYFSLRKGFASYAQPLISAAGEAVSNGL